MGVNVGYAREISWSSTRAKTMRDCPRGAWFAYYSKGEPHAARAATLRHLVTLPMAAGAAVDYVIARAIRSWRDEGQVLGGLADVGVRMLRRQHTDSLAVATDIARGGAWRPTRRAWMPPLHHHVYRYDVGQRYERAIEGRVAQCLESFESGEVWAVLRRMEPSGCHPIPRLGECPIPSFLTAHGLRVWSSVDLAVLDRGLALVLDWKTGRESVQALNAARAQLAVYAVWACRRFVVPPERVRVQAVWLQSRSRWSPERVERPEMDVIARRVKNEAAEEEALVSVHRSACGRVLRYHARIEDFPPLPSTRVCLPCRFRELCPEGREACGHV